MLIAGDLAAAIIAGAICAPLVAVIDEAITVSAAGKKKMWPAIGDKLVSILKAPLSFLASAPFLWLWAVYAVTYASANCTETVAKAVGASPATPVLLISTFANMSVCLLKDAAFARMFSGSAGKDDDAKKKAGLSRPVLLLWFGRDVTTQFFVFTLPVLLHGRVPDTLCRLSAPVVAQYFTTPFFLLGLKLFNLPPGTSIGSQWAAVRAMLFETVVARQIRIFPAFSVGGVVNKGLRVAIGGVLLG